MNAVVPSRRSTASKLASRITAAWADAWSSSKFRWTLFAALVAGTASPVLTRWIFSVVQRRPGLVPPEPLLPIIGPASVSTAIFTLLIGTMLLVAGGCLDRPLVLIRGVVAFEMLFTLRVITMMAVPLAAPPGGIPLHDPLGQVFYPGGIPETKDLFFSGHTATVVLLVALVRTRPAKVAVAAVAIVVGALLLVQHAHWTVDVLAAPLFAALAWRLSRVAAPALRRPVLPDRESFDGYAESTGRATRSPETVGPVLDQHGL